MSMATPLSPALFDNADSLDAISERGKRLRAAAEINAFGAACILLPRTMTRIGLCPSNAGLGVRIRSPSSSRRANGTYRCAEIFVDVERRRSRGRHARLGRSFNGRRYRCRPISRRGRAPAPAPVRFRAAPAASLWTVRLTSDMAAALPIGMAIPAGAFGVLAKIANRKLPFARRVDCRTSEQWSLVVPALA